MAVAVAVVVGQEGSKRSVVAAAGVMVVQRWKMDRDGSDVGGLSDRIYPAVAMSKNQKRKWRRCGGWRGQAIALLDESKLHPIAGDDDDMRLPGHSRDRYHTILSVPSAPG